MERTIEKSKDNRFAELEKKRQLRREKKKLEHRAKQGAAVTQEEARKEAQRVLDLANQVANKQQTNEEDDDASFASNISVGFTGPGDSEMSIEGEDPAPENIKNMVKNAVKGLYDPKAWEHSS